MDFHQCILEHRDLHKALHGTITEISVSGEDFCLTVNHVPSLLCYKNLPINLICRFFSFVFFLSSTRLRCQSWQPVSYPASFSISDSPYLTLPLFQRTKSNDAVVLLSANSLVFSFPQVTFRRVTSCVWLASIR